MTEGHIFQEKRKILKEFQTLPGVGKSIAEDLYDLGYRSLDEFKTAEPIMMYERLCMKAGKHLDRCLLYTFRCVVYYASTKEHDPKMLKWWNWKDKEEVFR
jgi:hypothetical protein